MGGDDDFDLDGAMDDIAADMAEPEESTQEAEDSPQKDVSLVESTRDPPKSWAKEHHENWSKLAPESQDYIQLREKQMHDGLDMYKGDAGYGKQMRESVQPYQQVLQAQGIDAPQAVRTLLDAHVRLSQGTQEEKRAFMAEIARNYGVSESTDELMDAPPEIRALNDKIERLQAFTNGQAAQQQQATHAKVQREVELFSNENPYFEDVADDIISFLNTGADLQSAYDKAVWANPVTRQKEIARLQEESEKQLREKARAEVAAARKASSTNVRDRDTTRGPTDPLGTMEDTMKETLHKIRDRAH